MRRCNEGNPAGMSAWVGTLNPGDAGERLNAASCRSGLSGGPARMHAQASSCTACRQLWLHGSAGHWGRLIATRTSKRTNIRCAGAVGTGPTMHAPLLVS